MKDLVVLILAAGKSTRFWPLNDKNLFKFLGKQLINYQIEEIRKSGFPDIGIVGNEENINEFKKIPNLTVFLQKGKGQGAAILSAKEFITGKKVLIVNADDIVEPSLYLEFQKWINSLHIDGVLCGYGLNRYLPLGYYVVNNENFVTKVIEKPKKGQEPSNLARIVVDFFRDGNKLIDYLSKVNYKNECLYELGMEKMLAHGFKFKLIKYSSYWGILKYPWQTLDLVDYFLTKVKGVKIGRNVRIAKNSLFSGNVLIEDNVRILENVKIVGPCYIGKNTIIGNNALIRASMIGQDCLVGFATEITRSYVGDQVWFHTNYIGDSIISDNVSFGAGGVTANLRLDEGEIKSLIKNEKINTYKTKLGAIVGEGGRVGVNTSLMPGVKIGKSSFVGAGLVLDKDIPDNTFCYGETRLVIKKNKFKIKEDKREDFKKKLEI